MATFSYDGLNRRTGASYADGSTTSFAYDAAGRLTQASDTVGGTILNAYDSLDRLVSQATGLGTISYQYDTLGRRTRMDASGQASVFYGYDAASRLRTITQAPLNPVAIEYDALGRRTLLTLPNGVSTEYQYDTASRLTALIYRNALGLLGDLTYQYDAAGNRTRIGGAFARTLLPDSVPSATYDAANRQLTFGDKALTYDATGNLTLITEPNGSTTLTWDARDRLATLISPGVTGSFAYDALGRRVKRTLNGSTARYLYDGDDINHELVEGVAVTYLRSLNIDEPLARNGSEFYLADPLGSIVGLIDSAGNVATRYAFDPFGRTAAEGTVSLNSVQYTGRENDGTGLYYYRARYYAPMADRFVQEDPAALFGGTLNYYTYALNDPVGYADPLGLKVDYSGYTVANKLLSDRLELLSQQLGRDIVVTGGDRDPAKNKAAGGASSSKHLTGGAVDFHIQGISDLDAAQRTAESGLFHGIGYYPPGSPLGPHVHADLRFDGTSPRWRHDRDQKGHWRYVPWYDRTHPLPPVLAPRIDGRK